jgi:serine/threonine-protein kinase
VLAPDQGDPATSTSLVGTAYDANPLGNLQKGTTVTVSFYTAVAPPPAPSAATTAQPSPYPPASTVPISWTAYTCPSGSTLKEYDLTVVNGTATDENPILPTNTSEVINVGNTGTTTVTYTATCTSNGTDAVSATSPALSLTIGTPVTP